MKKNKSLGKNIEDLFKNHSLNSLMMQKEEKKEETPQKTEQNGITKQLNLEAIETDSLQPRKYFDEEKIQDLANSIKNQGVIQPIVVVKLKHGSFKIVAGERRYRAAKLAGLTKIPVIVKDYTEQEAALAALVENIQREDLNAIERAQALSYVSTFYKIKQNDLAQLLGLSRSFVSNSLRLLKLDDSAKEAVQSGEITEGHAKVLASLPLDEQAALCKQIIKKNISVRSLETLLVTKSQKKTKHKTTRKKKHSAIEQTLEDYFLARVELQDNGKQKGKVVIYYNSHDELDGILKRIIKDHEIEFC